MNDSIELVSQQILGLLPKDGTSKGNGKIRSLITPEVTEEVYKAAKDALIATGSIKQGRGRGGSIFLVNPTEAVAHVAADTSEGEGSESPSDVGAPELVSGAPTSVATCPAPVASAEAVATSVGEEVVVRALVNKPWISMPAWVLEVVDILKEKGKTLPGVRQVVDDAKNGKCTTDTLIKVQEDANKALAGTGTWLHYSKGLVLEK